MAALVDHEIAGAQVPQIVVENTVKALGALAKHNIERRRALESPFTVIGITGSVGKTTTKDLLKSLLSKMGDTVAPVGSFNNEIGLPLTSLKVNAGTRFLVAEMGANHVGEIANLTSLVPPDIAMVLKVGVAHLGEFGSAERIAQAKSEIVRGLVPGGLTILNANDEHVAAMSAIAPADVLWFGLPQKEDAQLDTTARDVRCDELDHPSFVLEDKTGRHANVTLGICGQHNVMNALAAATVAMTLGMPIETWLRPIRRDEHQPASHGGVHRHQARNVVHTDRRFVQRQPRFHEGRTRWSVALACRREQQPFRIAVLGAMLELGPDEHRLHEDVADTPSRAVRTRL